MSATTAGGTDWSVVVAVVAALIALGSSIVARWQLQEARKANAFPGAVDLFREYRNADMVAARHLLVTTLWMYEPSRGMRGLPGEIGEAARTVSHYLDNLGVLVKNGLVRSSTATSFIGGSVVEMWLALAPFILAERRLGSRDYQRFFEHLAAEVDAIGQHGVVRDLRRWHRWPSEHGRPGVQRS